MLQALRAFRQVQNINTSSIRIVCTFSVGSALHLVPAIHSAAIIRFKRTVC